MACSVSGMPTHWYPWLLLMVMKVSHTISLAHPSLSCGTIGGVTTVDLGVDGRTLVTGGKDKTIGIWTIKSS